MNGGHRYCFTKRDCDCRKPDENGVVTVCINCPAMHLGLCGHQGAKKGRGKGTGRRRKRGKAKEGKKRKKLETLDSLKDLVDGWENEEEEFQVIILDFSFTV